MRSRIRDRCSSPFFLSFPVGDEDAGWALKPSGVGKFRLYVAQPTYRQQSSATLRAAPVDSSTRIGGSCAVFVLTSMDDRRAMSPQ
jgi:hypothetical protein